MLKVSLGMNSTPLTVSLLQQAAQVLPAHDSRAGHLLYTYRQCGVMALRVWDEPSAPLLSTPSGGRSVSYESDMLALIAQLRDEGDSLGMSLYIVIHSFPFVVDFRPEVPASIHSAILSLVSKYHPLFSYNGYDIELRRLQAHAAIRQMRAGQGDRQQLAAEAERLLGQASRIVHYEKLLALKLQMTWTELRLLRGERDAAVTALRVALAELPEAETGQAFYVRRAKEWLTEIATADKLPWPTVAL